jgi:hypothetical protein
MRGFLLTVSALVALSMPALVAAPAVAQVAPEAARTSNLEFIAGPDEGDLRASRWIGAPVKNNAGETIGDVNDLVLTLQGQVKVVVIGVGGFIGLAEKNIAVALSDTQLRHQENGSNVVLLDTTKEALMAAPEFKVAGEKTMRDRLGEATKAVKSGYETVKEKAIEGYDRAKEAMSGDNATQPAPTEKQ